MNRPKLISLSLFGVVLLAIFALPLGLFGIEAGPGVYEELEVGWAQLEERVGTPRPGATHSESFDLLLEAWKEADGGGDADPETLLARARELLDLFVQQPEAVPSDTLALPLVMVAKHHLEHESLNAADLEAWIRLARRLQLNGPLIRFMVGNALLNSGLDACERDPSLLPTVNLPAPRKDEMYLAVCRELHALPGLIEDSFDRDSPSEVQFLRDAARLAAVRSLEGIDPERPDTWEQRGHALPSKWHIWKSTVLRDLEGLSKALMPFAGVWAGTRGKEWLETQRRWERAFAGQAPLAAHDEAAESRYGVRPLPAEDDFPLGNVSVRDVRAQGFTKGISIPGREGGAVWIIAQPGVRDIAVARAHNLLRFFLKPIPGDGYGSAPNKRRVLAKMIENRALLMMPEGRHREGEEPDLPAQPLYEDETPVDGSRWYIENDWEHRDAAFEEIFHLVHDTGIGTDFPGALPTFQQELDREARAAIEDGRWGRPADEHVGEWLEELEAENSLAQEYIASALDTFYGLWGAFDERPGGMWGIYCAKTRAEQAQLDAAGMGLLTQFLPEDLTGYEALIDPAFEGTFCLAFDPEVPYTHKSRYLVEVTLTGTKPSHLLGNERDNVLRGNHGDNQLIGGEGTDTAVFSGRRADYEFQASGDVVHVQDTVTGRDGRDSIRSIERLRFADGEFSAAESPSEPPR